MHLEGGFALPANYGGTGLTLAGNSRTEAFYGSRKSQQVRFFRQRAEGFLRAPVQPAVFSVFR